MGHVWVSLTTFVITLLGCLAVRYLGRRLGKERVSCEPALVLGGGIGLLLMSAMNLVEGNSLLPVESAVDSHVGLILSLCLVAASLPLALGAIEPSVRLGAYLVTSVSVLVLLLIYGVEFRNLTNPFGGSFTLNWLGIPATALWFTALLLLFYLMGDAPCLAESVTILTAGIIMVMTGAHGEIYVVSLSAILVAGSLAILLARIPSIEQQLGIVGRQYFAVMLFVISVLARRKFTASVAMVIPLVLVLGVLAVRIVQHIEQRLRMG